MSVQEQLHQLFLLERQIRGLQGGLDLAQARMNAQVVKHQQFSRQRDEMAALLKQTQAHANRFEHEAQGMEEKVDHLREQMNMVTSNKEYSTLLVEVNTLKADMGKFEDQALEQLGRVDQLRNDLSDLEHQVTDQQKILDGAAAEVEDSKAEVSQRLESLHRERDEASQSLPADVLSLFNKLANDYDGDAMAGVLEGNRKHLEYSCGGCFITIPIERVNALMGRPEDAVCCPSCNRILYIDAKLKESLAG